MEQKQITEQTQKVPTWEELEAVYKSTAQTYIISANYLKNMYNKYKELIDKNPNTKRILDGATNTLMDIKRMIDTLPFKHIELATEKDKENGIEVFPGPDGELLKFKKGPIDEDNEELVNDVVKILLAYSNLNANIYNTTKNAIACVLTDLEKILDSIEDEKEKEKYLALLQGDKKELNEIEEGEPNGRSKNK